MDTFYSWLENHVAICTWVVASCSLLTFVLSFIFKKRRKIALIRRTYQMFGGLQ